MPMLPADRRLAADEEDVAPVTILDALGQGALRPVARVLGSEMAYVEVRLPIHLTRWGRLHG
jgi:hypothetical protein